MRFFRKRAPPIRAVYADDRTKRPFTVNGKPVRLIAIRESKRTLRKGKTQYIYLIDNLLYYNENQNHAWFSRFGNPAINQRHYIRAFTAPTDSDKAWLKFYGYKILPNPDIQSHKKPPCCKLTLKQTPPNESKAEFQIVSGDDGVDISDIDEWRNKWDPGIITNKVIQHSDDQHIREQQDKVLSVCLRSIQMRVKDIKFHRVYDEAESADIRVEFTSDLSVFGNNENILAQAYLPTNDPRTSAWSGLVQINDNYDWSIFAKKTRQSLFHTLLHELLHSIGFLHDEKDMDSVLYPYAIRKAIYFSARDLARLWKWYGKRIISEWMIKAHLKRIELGQDFD